jgi:phosphohistidine phosphatase
MKLHILRHAKTQVIAPSQKDFDRVLLPKGIEQSKKMAVYLNEKLSRKITVYCSSSARTKETAKLLQENFEFRDLRLTDQLYHADLMSLLDFIWKLEGKEDILLIGHNDGISDLASYFTAEYIGLQTCGYCCIEFDSDAWKNTSKGLGRLVDSFRPRVVLD